MSWIKTTFVRRGEGGDLKETVDSRWQRAGETDGLWEEEEKKKSVTSDLPPWYNMREREEEEEGPVMKRAGGFNEAGWWREDEESELIMLELIWGEVRVKSNKVLWRKISQESLKETETTYRVNMTHDKY